MCDGPDFFLCLLAILFPPLGVWVKRGICSVDSIINIALCALGYLPGVIHAWYIISKYPQYGYEQLEPSEAQVHVYHIRGGNGPPPSCCPASGAHSAPQGSYGTMGRGARKDNSPRRSRQATQPSGSAHQQSSSQQQNPSEQMSADTADIRKQPEGAGAGPREGVPPPSYADALKGDNKIQSHE